MPRVARQDVSGTLGRYSHVVIHEGRCFPTKGSFVQFHQSLVKIVHRDGLLAHEAYLQETLEEFFASLCERGARVHSILADAHGCLRCKTTDDAKSTLVVGKRIWGLVYDRMREAQST